MTQVDGIDLLATALPALRRMQNACREAFLDHYVLGHTSNQIAERHGVSPSAVRLSLTRARRVLWAHLEQEAA